VILHVRLAHDLIDKGVYGPAELRELPRPATAEDRPDLDRVLPKTLEDVVYRKHRR